MFPKTTCLYEVKADVQRQIAFIGNNGLSVIVLVSTDSTFNQWSGIIQGSSLSVNWQSKNYVNKQRTKALATTEVILPLAYFTFTDHNHLGGVTTRESFVNVSYTHFQNFL